MKLFKLILICLTILTMTSLCTAAYSPKNATGSPLILRAVSVVDDNGLDANNATWEAVESSPLKKDVTEKPVGVDIVRFRGKGATGSTCNWCYVGIKDKGEPPELIAYGTATLGVTATGNTDEYWFNTITIAYECWYSSIRYIPGYQYNLGTGVVTNGGIGKLFVDGNNYRFRMMFMSKGTCTAMGADYSTVPIK